MFITKLGLNLVYRMLAWHGWVISISSILALIRLSSEFRQIIGAGDCGMLPSTVGHHTDLWICVQGLCLWNIPHCVTDQTCPHQDLKTFSIATLDSDETMTNRTCSRLNQNLMSHSRCLKSLCHLITWFEEDLRSFRPKLVVLCVGQLPLVNAAMLSGIPKLLGSLLAIVHQTTHHAKRPKNALVWVQVDPT